jgi:NADH-quinone oxidoreductase subunit G
MPKVIVNDREIEVANGTSALDALFHAGFDVPYFCSNEYLSPVGACRMCLVEAGSPRKNPDGSWIMDDATGQPKLFFFPGTVVLWRFLRAWSSRPPLPLRSKPRRA